MPTPLDRYAFPGGYEFHYLTADGGALCHGCANRENGSIASTGPSPDGIEDDQWRIVNRFIHWEGPPIHCDHCGREIASEYGDPDPA
jgi:hypothetical protein